MPVTHQMRSQMNSPTAGRLVDRPDFSAASAFCSASLREIFSSCYSRGSLRAYEPSTSIRTAD